MPAYRRRSSAPRRWLAPAAAGGLPGLAAVVGLAAGRPGAGAVAAAVLAAAGAAALALARRREDGRRWADLFDLVDQVDGLAIDPSRPLPPPAREELTSLVAAISRLRLRLAAVRSPGPGAMTRSGLYDPTIGADPDSDPSLSREKADDEMVHRLDPETLAWLDCSPAAQEFLGRDRAALRAMTFPEVVHPDDRDLAEAQLREAVARGEAHGLTYRVRTAAGENRAVMLNVAVRYGPDMQPLILRCHLTDVTAKLRAGRELRRRTRALLLANEQLRRMNRELQELKDRYGDLYQNAPAMYFSLDESGHLRDCNDTMLAALGYRRDELVGRPYTRLLPEDLRPQFARRMAGFLGEGHIEVESRWQKADGQVIDVWVTGTAVRDPDGTIRLSRSVAQDITARKALQAELRATNASLARANAELSAKIRELDEFSYVVSHDLQEPLRTLIAFSDFLLRDYGERLDDEGREFVRYLVDASRRMRALIDDLLQLSRAGRAAGDFAPVDLAAVVATVQADLTELLRCRGAELRVEETLPTVWGDRARLGQLFGNLVGNGVKYNRATPPRIVVAAIESADGPVTIAVRDNGIGIEGQFHDKIFQMFRRLHPREEFEGTGAGLAICQKIVRAHGGRIWVESEPGVGSTFFVTLPRGPDAPARPPREPSNGS